MAELDLTNISGLSISTPGSNVLAVYADSAKRLATKDDSGYVRGLGYWNASSTSQAPAATTRTYLTGSNISFPKTGAQVGTCFRWTFNMTKTAAGVAASTIDIAFGTAGTTADTARVSFTKPAGTAVIDEGFCEIVAIVRGPISNSCIVTGEFWMVHNLAATGHAVIPCVAVSTQSAAFDITVSNLIAGVCITTGAADAITIQQVTAEAWNI